jgi:hypothetical protein
MVTDKLSKELFRMKAQAEEAVQEAYKLKGRLSQMEEQAAKLALEIREGIAEVKETYDF